MIGITWEGRQVGPTDLIGAAREARDRDWLDEPARRFLHHCGVCLATDRALSERQRMELDVLLHRLRQLGSTVLATTSRVVSAVESQPDIAALESDLASLRLFLASATERVDGYWQRLQRLKHGLPPEGHPLRES